MLSYMNNFVLPLATTVAQAQQLANLQAMFAVACNVISPIAQTNRCWNRVALHHLCYRQIREQFPLLGSQMACNAIYSVCRAYRTVLTHPESPWRLDKKSTAPLPRVIFSQTAPVYFDRHTLSVKPGHLSMFTLDGRLRFDLTLDPQHEILLREQRLLEIALRRQGEHFELFFLLTPAPLSAAEKVRHHQAVPTDIYVLPAQAA